MLSLAGTVRLLPHGRGRSARLRPLCRPVRAGLRARAIDWPWSSVRAHVEGRADPLLTPVPLAERLSAEMVGFFDLDVEEEARRKLRRASSTGRPLGASDWIKALEASTGRALAAPVMGRPVVGVARGG